MYTNSDIGRYIMSLHYVSCLVYYIHNVVGVVTKIVRLCQSGKFYVKCFVLVLMYN